MRDSFAHASEGADAVKASASDDQEVGAFRRVEQCVDRVSLLEHGIIGDRMRGGEIEILRRASRQGHGIDLESISKGSRDSPGRCRLVGPVDAYDDRARKCVSVRPPSSHEDGARRFVENDRGDTPERDADWT